VASATLESHKQRVDQFVYLDAIGRVAVALAAGCNVWTMEGSPWHDLPGEPEHQETLGEHFDKMLEAVFEDLWTGGPEKDAEVDAETDAAWRSADLLAAQMLLRLAGASEYCSRAAERFLRSAEVLPRAKPNDESEADNA
jgi:hypothetical protein